MRKFATKILLGFALIYCLTWLFFIIDGSIPTGGIDKSDWLMFWGSFLAFAGTALLGYVTYLQTQKADIINERLNKLQKDEYTPILKATNFIGLTKFEAFNIANPSANIALAEMRMKDDDIKLGYAVLLSDEDFDETKEKFTRTYEVHFSYLSKALLNSITFDSIEFVESEFSKCFAIGKKIDILMSNKEAITVFIYHISNQNHLKDTEASRLIKANKMIIKLSLCTFSGQVFFESISINKHFVEKGFKDYKDGKIECMVSSSFTIVEE